MIPTPRVGGVAAPNVIRTALTVQSEPPHGTRARYGHRTFHCRCSDCTEANSAYQRVYRARLADGSWSPRRWSQLTLPGV